MLGSSSVAAQLAASQEGLSSMKLVIIEGKGEMLKGKIGSRKGTSRTK
jgi:hypothetical protein